MVNNTKKIKSEKNETEGYRGSAFSGMIMKDIFAVLIFKQKA